MSGTIDNRIVSMEFDNHKFESNVQTSLKTLDKLKAALKFDKTAAPLEDVGRAAQYTAKNMEPLGQMADKVKLKFSALYYETERAYARISSTIKRLVKSMSIDQLSAGWNKYIEKTGSVQTIMNSTGKSINEVNHYLSRLMWFSDETSYSFNDMTSSLAQLTSSGGDIEKLIPMIMGVANATAYAGKGAGEFSRAIYNLNQSYSSGSLKLMDWKSLEMAGVASKELKQVLIDTGVALGKIRQGQVTVASFNESLSKGWATSEVMEQAFGKFSEFSEVVRKAVDSGQFETASEAMKALSKSYGGIGVTAFEAAQQAKSFNEAIDATKDAVSSGWMRTWEIIFGDFNEARILWTNFANTLWDTFAAGAETRNLLLEGSMFSNYKKMTNMILEAGGSVEQYENIIKDVAKFYGWDVDSMIKDYGSLEYVFTNGALKFQILEKATSKYLDTVDKTASLDKTLKMKDTGDDVKSLQQRLINLGYHLDKYGVDGKYGKETASAVKEFQKAMGLKQTGIVDDATLDKLNTENKLVKELGDNFYNLLYEVNNKGGRETLFDSLFNIYFAVEKVWSSIKGGFVDAFGTVDEEGNKVLFTPEKLLGAINKFKEFSEAILLSDENAEKLQNTFKGIFNIFGIVKDIAGLVGKAIFNIIPKGFISNLPSVILTATSGIADFITRVRTWVNTTDYIPNFLAAVGNKISNAGSFIWTKFSKWFSSDTVQGIVMDLKTKFANLGTWIEDSFTKVTDWLNSFTIEDAITWWKNLPTTISEWAKTIDFDSAWTWITDGYDNMIKWFNSIDLSGVWNWISNLYNSAKDWFSGFDLTPIWNFIKTIPGKVYKWFSNLSFSDIWHSLTTSTETIELGDGSVFTTITKNWFGKLLDNIWGWVKSLPKKISSWFKKLGFDLTPIANWFSALGTRISKAFDSVGIDFDGIWAWIKDIPNKFKKLFNSETGLFDLTPIWNWIKDIPNKISNFFKQINLTKIKTAANNFIKKVVEFFSNLFGTKGEKKKISKEGKEQQGFLASIVGFLNNVFEILSEIGPTLLAIAPLMTLLFAIIVAFKSVKSITASIAAIKVGEYKKSALQNFTSFLETLGKTMLTMSIAFRIMSKIDSASIVKSVLAMTAIITVFTIASKINSKYDTSKLGGVGTNMLAMAGSLIVFGLAIKMFSRIDWDTIKKSLAGLGVFMGFFAASSLISKFIGADVKSFGVNMLSLSGSLILFAVALKMFSRMDINTILKGVIGALGMIGAMAGAMAASKFLGVDAKNFGIMMAGMGAGLMLFALSVAAFGRMKYSTIVKGVGAIVVLLGAMTVITKVVAGGNIEASGAKSILLLLGMVGAFSALVAAVKVLSYIKTSDLFKAAGVVVALIASLTIMSRAMRGMSISDVKNMAIMMGIIAGFAVAIGGLAWAAKKFAGLSAKDLRTVFTGIALVLLGLSNVFKQMSKIKFNKDFSMLAGLKAIVPILVAFGGILALILGAIEFATWRMGTWGPRIAEFIKVVIDPVVSVFGGGLLSTKIGTISEDAGLVSGMIAVGNFLVKMSSVILNIAKASAIYGITNLLSTRTLADEIDTFKDFVVAVVPAVADLANKVSEYDINTKNLDAIADIVGKLAEALSKIPMQMDIFAAGGLGKWFRRKRYGQGIAVFGVFNANIRPMIKEFTEFMSTVLPEIIKLIESSSVNNISYTKLNNLSKIVDTIVKMASILGDIPNKFELAGWGGTAGKLVGGVAIGKVSLTVTPMFKEVSDFLFGTDRTQGIVELMSDVVKNIQEKGIKDSAVKTVSNIVDIIINFTDALNKIPEKFVLDGFGGGGSLGLKGGFGGKISFTASTMLTEFGDMIATILPAIKSIITRISTNNVTVEHISMLERIMGTVVDVINAVAKLPQKFHASVNGLGGHGGSGWFVKLGYIGVSIDMITPLNELVAFISSIGEPMIELAKKLKDRGLNDFDLKLLTSFGHTIRIFTEAFGALGTLLQITAGGGGGFGNVDFAKTLIGLKNLGLGFGGGGGGLSVTQTKPITDFADFITSISSPMTTLITSLKEIPDATPADFDNLVPFASAVQTMATGFGQLGTTTEVDINGGAGGGKFGWDNAIKALNAWGFGASFNAKATETLELDNFTEFLEIVLPKIEGLITTIKDKEFDSSDFSNLESIASIISTLATASGSIAKTVTGEGDAVGGKGGVGSNGFTVGAAWGSAKFNITPMLTEFTTWCGNVIPAIEELIPVLRQNNLDSYDLSTIDAIGQFINDLALASGNVPSITEIKKTSGGVGLVLFGGVFGGVYGESEEVTTITPMLNGFRDFIRNIKTPISSLIKELNGITLSEDAPDKLNVFGSFITTLAKAMSVLPKSIDTIGNTILPFGTIEFSNSKEYSNILGFKEMLDVLLPIVEGYLDNISDQKINLRGIKATSEFVLALAETMRTLVTADVAGDLTMERAGKINTFFNKLIFGENGQNGLIDTLNAAVPKIGSLDYRRTNTLVRFMNAYSDITNAMVKAGPIKSWVDSNIYHNIETLGAAIRLFSEQLTTLDNDGSTFDETKVTAAAESLSLLANAFVVLDSLVWSEISTSNLETNLQNVSDALKSIDVDEAEVSGAKILAEIISGLAGADLDSIDDIINTINGYAGGVDVKAFSEGASSISKSIIYGIDTSLNGSGLEITSIASKFVGNIVKALIDQKAPNQTKQLGAEMVRALGDGIYGEAYVAEAKARFMGQRVIDAIRKALGLSTKNNTTGGNDNGDTGNSSVWGSVLGSESGVFSYATRLGKSAFNGLEDAMMSSNKLIDSTLSNQLVIRPKLDLSDVKDGAGYLASMLNGTNGSIRVAAVAAGAGMVETRRSDASDILAAVKQIANNQPAQNVYSVGNVTYDDGSNVADAVANLVKAVRVERRL